MVLGDLVLLYLVTTLPDIGNHPIVGGDEGWIISASAKLAEQGVFGSDLFEGFFGAGEHYYFNLPLHHLFLAGVFEVFGVGLIQARLVSAAFGLLVLGLTYALGRRVGGLWVGVGAAALLVLLRLNLAPFSGLTLADLGATVRYDLIAVPFALGAVLVLVASAQRLMNQGRGRPGADILSYGGELRAAPAGARELAGVSGEFYRPGASSRGGSRLAGAGAGYPQEAERAGQASRLEGPGYGKGSWREKKAYAVQRCGAELLAGLILGLGVLTQFIAGLMIAPLGLFLLTLSIPWRERILRLSAFGLGVLLPLLPYIAYVASDWYDFRGQSRSFEQRSDVLAPGFYFDNLRHELERYDLAVDIDAALSLSEAAERPSARLVFLLVGPASLAYLFVRGRRNSLPHRLLAFTLAGLVFEFALLESTKRFVYWVIAAPFLCVALADAAAAVLSWRPQGRMVRRMGPAMVALIAAIFALEGLAAGAKNVLDARDAADYSRVGDEVRAVLPPGSRVVTDNRMWLTLRDVEARSLLLLFYWTNPEIAGEELTDVQGAMERTGAEYLLVSPLTKEILQKLTPRDSERFNQYVAGRGRLVATVSKPPYGPIEVYELR